MCLFMPHIVNPTDLVSFRCPDASWLRKVAGAAASAQVGISSLVGVQRSGQWRGEVQVTEVRKRPASVYRALVVRQNPHSALEMGIYCSETERDNVKMYSKYLVATNKHHTHTQISLDLLDSRHFTGLWPGG